MEWGRLAAWVDGERDVDDADVAAHAVACPICAAAVAEMRQHRERLRRYRAATTPAVLPPAVWSAVRAGLDKQDKHKQDRQRQARQTVGRTVPATVKPAAFAAVLLCLGLCFSLFALPRLWPAAVPVAALLSRPAAAALPGPALSTGDADAAARWLSQQLGQEVPVVSLALTDASLVNAQADMSKDDGTLLFRSASGVPLALHIFLHARLAPAQTSPAQASAVSYSAVSYRGSVYQVASGPRTLNTLVLWQSGGQTFAAVAPLPPPQLLPYVHEMSRRCLPGH